MSWSNTHCCWLLRQSWSCWASSWWHSDSSPNWEFGSTSTRLRGNHIPCPRFLICARLVGLIWRRSGGHEHEGLAMETEESVLNELQDRSWRWQRDAAIALLLTVLAFAVRLNHVDFNSLSEDESA